jgi:uncharacterized repeat protein (TIGR04138 family)
MRRDKLPAVSVSNPPPPATPDWTTIRARARSFPPGAFDFVRDGLAHTVQKLSETKGEALVPESEAIIAEPKSGVVGRHISGQQLCAGLREMARERYGMLALTVLHRWGVRSTADFGVMVYALIDRGEMRCSDQDRFDDFLGQYDFEKAFATEVAQR